MINQPKTALNTPSQGADGRQSHIRGALERCFSEVVRLDNLVDQLQQRLESCCTLATPQVASEKTKEESNVPLAGEINNLREKLSFMADRISDLTQRIEL